MNKVFQINLSGIIIRIDENAYERLSEYIHQLKNHFTDNPEIMHLVQQKIAEQLINLAGANEIVYINHVDDLIKLMGEPNNFLSYHETTFNNPSPRKLRRNPYDENLGGVCSGIAYFFGVDPIIIRILFLIAVLMYGTGILFYLILWVVIPKADGKDAAMMKFAYERQYKKLYRDDDKRLIGGVSSGLAYYFGIEIIWIRVLFLVSLLLFGTGFWLYILLWIIIPKAKTENDKLLMKGFKPASGNVYKHYESINKLNSESINKTSKVMRNAFRLLSSIVAFFIFIVIVSLSIVMVAFYFGVSNIDWLNQIINLTFTEKTVVWSLKIGILLIILTPLVALLLMLLKFSFHIRTQLKNWIFVLIVSFITGFALLLYASISFGSDISRKNVKNKIIQLEPNDTLFVYGIETKEVKISEETNDEQTGELTFYNKGMRIEKGNVYIEINNLKISQLAYGNKPLLKIKLQSKGKNADDAADNIKYIVFNPEISRNKIHIPQFFSLKPDAKFRWQEVSVEIQVPENMVMVFDETAKNIADDSNMDEADGKIYKMKNGMLNCIDCILAENDKSNHADEIEVKAGPVEISVKNKARKKSDETEAKK